MVLKDVKCCDLSILRINSGGGYGGPERSIECYARYGEGAEFRDHYYLLAFSGCERHVEALVKAGGVTTTLIGKKTTTRLVNQASALKPQRLKTRVFKPWINHLLPHSYKVRRASLGWAATGCDMMRDHLADMAESPDIIHIHASHYFMSAGIYQACRQAFPGVPVVVHFHNGPVFAEPGVCEKAMIRSADLCLFNSRYCEQAWRPVAKPGASRFMPNPIEFPDHDISARSIRDEKIVIGTLGRLSPIKGIDVALRAFAEASKRDTRLSLEIAGEGPEEHNLRALAATLGCADRVRFLGFAGDVYALLSRWHVLLQPTKTIEAFGRTVVEAMACRCAVIASRVGGLPENVIDGKTGMLVSPGEVASLADAITCLLRDQDTYTALVEQGYQHARKYEAKAATRELADCYRDLLGR